MNLSKRAARVVEICKAGGYARHMLETDPYTRREQFAVRVFDASGNVVKRLGYKAVFEAVEAGAIVRDWGHLYGSAACRIFKHPDVLAAEAA